MQIDKTSFNDISIFNHEEEYSIFHRLNFTRTSGGKEWLRHYFNNPFADIEKIKSTQNIIRHLMEHVDEWPEEITNGTMVVMDRFLDYNLDAISKNPGKVDVVLYKILHNADYSMALFSIKHFADFLRGLKKIVELLKDVQLSSAIRFYLDNAEQLLRFEPLAQLAQTHKEEKITPEKALYYAAHFRSDYKNKLLELIDIYSRLDAWYSMAVAVKKYDLAFPEFVEQNTPLVNVTGLYHILLHHPVPYNIDMDRTQNFLFLTGANMAGKSTLIKALGAAVFLAHIGMGVPAKNMQLTKFDGLISNINVVDNITKGESFFFNEVQRIKNTIERISNGQKWLVLIDELFKGTNIEDAMKCSSTVIKGLLKVPTSLFVLSTHLYEIGEELQSYPNITFRHFETIFTDEALSFSYQLREGISKDRLGYVILKRENVVDMLDRL